MTMTGISRICASSSVHMHRVVIIGGGGTTVGLDKNLSMWGQKPGMDLQRCEKLSQVRWTGLTTWIWSAMPARDPQMIQLINTRGLFIRESNGGDICGQDAENAWWPCMTKVSQKLHSLHYSLAEWPPPCRSITELVDKAVYGLANQWLPRPLNWQLANTIGCYNFN